MKKKVKKLGKGDKIASLIEEQPFDKEQAVNTLKSIGDITSAPQKSVTKLITGKYQSPSEAMKIDNFWGALATDVLLDPLVLIGMEKGATKLLSKEKFIDNIIIDPLTAARNRAERMISQKAKWSPENLPYTEDLYRNIDNNFVVDKAANWQHQPSSLGVRRGDKAVIFEDAPITPSQKKYIASHETGHLYSNSTEEANGWLDNFNYNQWKGRYLRGRPIRGNEDGAIDLTNLSKNSGQSVAPGNANEIRERAAQLKDYIAYKKKIPLNKDFIVTEKDLDDAIKNFTKSTGLDNNMTQMLSALKDKKGFLKQINLQPLGIVPAVGAGILSQNNTEQFKDGGKMSIHIKDSHKGRFTEYKKRTGKTTEEALHSKDPHVRQMANFARNAKKWNHAGEGDNIDPDLKVIPNDKVRRLDSLAFRMRDIQADQTLKLINAHPDIPIREILMRAENDPSFRNRKINRMADSLTTLYGKNPYIPASEEFIHSADEYNKVINENGYNFNLLGENEDTKLQKFGWRSMLQKQLHRSSEPAYKVLEPLAKFGNGGEADEYTEWSQTNGMSDAVKPKNPLNFGMNNVAPLATGIISGIQQLGQEKKKLQKARQWKAVSDVTLKASQIAPEEHQRMYVRPEDIPLSGEELFPMQGTGTNILARDGKTVKAKEGWMSEGAIYDFASQGGGDIASKILSGIQGENGGATLGGTLGKTAGSIIGGPVGGMIGEVGGKLIGGLLDQKPRKIKEAQQQTEHNVSLMGINNASQGLHSQYSSFMKNGGKLGDHLTLYDGEAEPISYNPYMEDGGETILFKGPSHEEGGIPITYGNSPVEVEGGEPATKIDDSLVVFGNLPINKEHASLLNDPKAKGMKFKNYITSLSKEEQHQNGIIKKSAEKAGELSSNSFDTLTLSSMKANVEGAEYKLKQIAQKKQNAAFLQEAINKTAEEKKMPAEKMIKAGGGVKVKGTNIKDTIRSAVDPKYWKDIEDLPKFKYIPSDEENIKMAYGMEDKPYPGSSESSSSTLTYIPPKKKEKIPYADILNSILPYVRPTDAEPLDSRQLLGEMYALSNNSLEPVKAQTYIPTLEIPYTLSLQDVLDQNNSDFRSLERTFTQNPEALSALSAQKYQANQKVLGEQFRINQENKAKAYSQNRQILNDAQLKNLGILDNQYERQERAKSNTKQTTQDALSSIASKYLQNQAENRTLQAYENLYNYRFDDSGRAINWNGVPTFNTEGSNTYRTLPSNEEYIYNSKGEPIDIRKKPAVKKTGKNGIIVKSLKKI